MTKTLTEQWREGTLPAGYYYIIANTKARNKVIFYLPGNTNTDGAVIKGEVVNGEDGGWVVEVLAPVPSYDKVKEMSQKIERLEFDNEALEMAHNEGKEINAELVSKTEQLEKRLEIATKALKEYERCENGSYANKALALIKGVK